MERQRPRAIECQRPRAMYGEAATGHGTSAATGHRMSAATGHVQLHRNKYVIDMTAAIAWEFIAFLKLQFKMFSVGAKY